ncbi:MAG: response regulator [Caulobacter sp.]|nr:response regulator [Caulobacter sp.]
MELGLGELKVLLVDDNDHMRTIVGTILKGIGILNVREARDGSEALEALRTWPADLAIVDFRMEPMDGVDFTRLIRNAADSRNPFLPIIMMTGFADRPRVEEARDSGVTELIVKPVTARAIIDRLNAVVYRPRPFVRTADYFGPRRRGIDDVAMDDQQSGVAHI